MGNKNKQIKSRDELEEDGEEFLQKVLDVALELGWAPSDEFSLEIHLQIKDDRYHGQVVIVATDKYKEEPEPDTDTSELN